MHLKQYIYYLSRTSLLLVLTLLFSSNMHAVKNSAAGIGNPQESSVIIDKQEKPNFFQRLGSKVLSKRLQKKIKKLKVNANTSAPLKKGLAIAALVLGILAFLTSVVGIVLGILAVIFGSIALKRIREEPEKYGGRKMAIAGLILGIVFLGLVILFAFVILASIAGFFFF